MAAMSAVGGKENTDPAAAKAAPPCAGGEDASTARCPSPEEVATAAADIEAAAGADGDADPDATAVCPPTPEQVAVAAADIEAALASPAAAGGAATGADDEGGADTGAAANGDGYHAERPQKEVTAVGLERPNSPEEIAAAAADIEEALGQRAAKVEEIALRADAEANGFAVGGTRRKDDEAATKIQAQYRGYRQRKLDKQRRRTEAAAAQARADTAALVKANRAADAKAEAERQAAATKIQARYRGHQQRARNTQAAAGAGADADVAARAGGKTGGKAGGKADLATQACPGTEANTLAETSPAAAPGGEGADDAGGADTGAAANSEGDHAERPHKEVTTVGLERPNSPEEIAAAAADIEEALGQSAAAGGEGDEGEGESAAAYAALTTRHPSTIASFASYPYPCVAGTSAVAPQKPQDPATAAAASFAEPSAPETSAPETSTESTPATLETTVATTCGGGDDDLGLDLLDPLVEDMVVALQKAYRGAFTKDQAR